MVILGHGRLRRGKLQGPSSWVGVRQKCGNCNCVFILFNEDGSKVRSRREREDLDEGDGARCHINYKYVKCPECKRKVTLELYPGSW